jgi:hypothetical protein
MTEPSGIQWCNLYPGSHDVADLIEPFRTGVKEFIFALEQGGATVNISATFRPPERAYLMHWCCMIAKGQDPTHIPPFPGVDIDWAHAGDIRSARQAAQDMMRGYNVAFPAVLVSRHTQRRAIDMTIHWMGAINVLDKDGVKHYCVTQSDLWPVGASFGVRKLLTDAPHWSDDGH